MTDSVAVAVARAALVAQGHEQYAEQIEEDPNGMPRLPTPFVHKREILRAFAAGHVAAGHDARLIGWPQSLWCDTCLHHWDRDNLPSP